MTTTVSPNLDDSPLTPWVAWTPTFTGLGAVTGINFRSRRVGQNLEIEGSAVTGNPTATEARMSIGFNGTDANVNAANNYPNLGAGKANLVGRKVDDANHAYNITALCEAGLAYLTFGSLDSTNNGLTKYNGNGVFTAGQVFCVQASVRIQGW